MLFLKVALVAVWSFTAVASKDNGGCAAFPREEASLGNHAMLQQSAKPSKGDVLAVSTGACDWQCYLNRYPDLVSIVGADNVIAAEKHWNTIGKSEGRDCTCVPVESLVLDGTANAAELTSQLKASADVIDAVTSCQPLSLEAQEFIAAEIKDYEKSEKFQQKILEAEGKSPASAGHVSIMKYLREKVLKKGFSVLELGCGAGGMLRFIEDEYNFGWGGGYYAEAVPHGSLVGVELVPGWVKFAQEHLKNISIFQGDITEYSLPEPHAGERFDLVMLNDVLEHVQKNRFGCFFSQLDKVTKVGSLVYMHTPSPMAQLQERKKMLSGGITQTYENVVPHHFVVTGMATMGFELLAFEHDMDTVCGGESENLPKQLQGAHCYHNGWPKYTHHVFRKVDDADVMTMS